MEGPIKEVNFRFKIACDTTLPDPFRDAAALAFNEFPSTLDVTVQHASWRISQEALYSTVADSFEVPRNPCQSPRCACCAGERVHFAICLSPYLWASGLDMCLTVGCI